jgi:hypothetical protein
VHQAEDQRNGIIAVSFLIGALLLVLVYLVGNAYFEKVRYDVRYEQNLSVENPELKNLRTRESTALGSYQWRDQAQGLVTIPIERAMELVVEEARGREGR